MFSVDQVRPWGTAGRSLYKYRSLQGDQREYTERLIVRHEAYFALAARFNDPFDCCVTMRMTTDEQKAQRELLRIMWERSPDMRQEQRAELVQEKLAKGFLEDPTVLAKATADMQNHAYGLGYSARVSAQMTS